MIRQTFGIDPAGLEDQEWFDLYAKYKYLKEIDRQIIVSGTTEALVKVIKAVTDRTTNGDSGNTMGN